MLQYKYKYVLRGPRSANVFARSCSAFGRRNQEFDRSLVHHRPGSCLVVHLSPGALGLNHFLISVLARTSVTERPPRLTLRTQSFSIFKLELRHGWKAAALRHRSQHPPPYYEPRDNCSKRFLPYRSCRCY